MSQDLNTKTYTEQTAEDTAATRRYTAHTLISPKGQAVRVAHNAVAARLAAGYRYAE
jgi:hypothetical protein